MARVSSEGFEGCKVFERYKQGQFNGSGWFIDEAKGKGRYNVWLGNIVKVDDGYPGGEEALILNIRSKRNENLMWYMYQSEDITELLEQFNVTTPGELEKKLIKIYMINNEPAGLSAP